jgi:hypothetical protein
MWSYFRKHIIIQKFKIVIKRHQRRYYCMPCEFFIVYLLGCVEKVGSERYQIHAMSEISRLYSLVTNIEGLRNIGFFS